MNARRANARLSRFEAGRKTGDGVAWLTVRSARHNNLKNLDAAFPLGRFVCVTGVSGSGKSSLVNDILHEQLARTLNGAEKAQPGDHDAIDGSEHLDKVIDIDQSPIGRTPRSNPATYIKVFDEIRRLYAKLPDSKVRGYAPGRFSFNVPTGNKAGGRCEACEGHGARRVEMDFLADVWTQCPVCEGRRFNNETLQVHYRGKSIFDVLNMDVQEALVHFDAIPRIKAMLSTLHAVGLDYLKLGQSSTTLSGGEAQRIKLARELVKRSTGRTLYLLDEPTTGLHFDDIRRLLAVLHGFVDAGNTVIVVEHNLDVIKTADWVIDLGPEGGDEGGRIVVAGPPEKIAASKRSYTGESLREVLSPFKKNRTGRQQSTSASRRSLNSQKTLPSRRRKPAVDGILVVGAREHNLKDVTVGVPRGAMTVCSGVSGSGKTSFAMDTVYVEGQRRYVESLSAYARQFLGQFQKPAVDHVHGLSPAIAIEQKGGSKSPRSTVGTVTEIYDYMRVLWARVGRPHCPRCGEPIGTQTSDEIADRICAMPEGTRLILCAPVERGPGETWNTLLTRCRSQGYVRVRIDGEVVELDQRSPAPLRVSRGRRGVGASATGFDAKRKHTVQLVVDLIIVRKRSRRRIADSIEHCLALGKGVMLVVVLANGKEEPRASARAASHRERSVPSSRKSARAFRLATRSSSPRGSLGLCSSDSDLAAARRSPLTTRPAGNVLRFSQHLACNACGKSYDELTPHHFSFNSRLGWCPQCEGLGVQRGTSADAVMIHPDRSILGGAVAGWQAVDHRPLLKAMLTALARATGFDPQTPCCELTPQQRHALLFGLPDRWVTVQSSAAHGLRFQWKGFFPAIDEATRSSWTYRRRLEDLVTDIPCLACEGGRIRAEAKAVKLGGRSIVDVCTMPLADAAAFFKSLRLNRHEARIAGELLHEIKSRLRFLVDVGLGYLTLSRAAPTLSGGEAQRIRLASQIGSGLTGVLYVLDEPTIGLHPRDNQRLIGALHKLRDLGNTLLMVEHDANILAAADHLIDFGPGAGVGGGRVVAFGTPARLKRQKDSLTGRYLAGKAAIPVPSHRRPVEGFSDTEELSYVPDDEPRDNRDEPRPSARAELHPAGGASPTRMSARAEARGSLSGDACRSLTIVGARQNNLRGIDAAFPLGRFICVTGVSGSGKSSLISETLYPALAFRLHRARLTPGPHDEIRGIELVDKVINVDQQPIGNTPSSNPATYTGVFDLIRAVFARLPESKVRGYTVNRFSFNRPGGRCDDCDGLGQVCYEMHFLPDVWVPCETCGGKRYGRETLEVRYKGKNIAEVLEMQVCEALTHFANIPKIRRLLKTLADVGLGYLPLGQSASTLSGGEAQRVKLAAELGRPSTGKTLYILDEPTTGLHFDDLRKLLDVLHRLVDMGNTVVCIEHNLDVIKTADWIIDLGPEAGDKGGTIVAEGTPELIAALPASHTGRILKKVLAAGPRQRREVFDARKAAAQAAAVRQTRLLLEEHKPIKMPWQRDGRRWHTQQRASRDAKTVEWEGAALEYVVDQIERLGKSRLASTDWNDRARVEVSASPPEGLAKAAVPWFLHALTAGRWLLDLSFRVPKGTFSPRPLNARLGLKTLDQRDDIEAYGDAPRVGVRAALNQMDQVRLLVHDKKEIATPAFRAFLKQALAAYLGHVDKLAARAGGAEPWKTDGKAWHLSQKSISPNQPKRWRPIALTILLGQVNKIIPTIHLRWDRKAFVEIITPGAQRVGKIITNNGDALRVDLHVPRGWFTPTQVEHLGIRQEFARSGAGGAELSFWFRSVDEVRTEPLKAVLLAAYAHAAKS